VPNPEKEKPLPYQAGGEIKTPIPRKLFNIILLFNTFLTKFLNNETMFNYILKLSIIHIIL